MKIQFGNIEIRVPYEKYMLQKLTRMGNPFETMFSKSNHDFCNDFFKKSQSIFTNYFEEHKKWMEKFSEMNKPKKNEG